MFFVYEGYLKYNLLIDIARKAQNSTATFLLLATCMLVTDTCMLDIYHWLIVLVHFFSGNKPFLQTMHEANVIF